MIRRPPSAAAGLTPRLKRTQTTIITAAVAIVLLYLGVFVFDAVDRSPAVLA